MRARVTRKRGVFDDVENLISLTHVLRFELNLRDYLTAC